MVECVICGEALTWNDETTICVNCGTTHGMFKVKKIADNRTVYNASDAVIKVNGKAIKGISQND